MVINITLENVMLFLGYYKKNFLQRSGNSLVQKKMFPESSYLVAKIKYK